MEKKNRVLLKIIDHDRYILAATNYIRKTTEIF